MSAVPRILVVDDDSSIRRLVRTALELEGFTVIESATLAQARSVHTEQVDGVVLDRQLPDGDGLAAYHDLRVRFPDARIVLHSATHVPDGYPSVPKGDVDALVDYFGPPPSAAPPVLPSAPPEVARALADEIVEDWTELCRWDPELPAESRPPIAGSVVAAVTSALERPQPVGWGLDPALEPVAEVYLLNHDSLNVAVSQLVCLGEVFERKVVDAIEVGDRLETSRRLTMILQRLMTMVVRAGVAQLEEQAFTNPLTVLGNSRAFGVDLRQEAARAARHGRPLTVMRLAIDGIDAALGADDGLRRVGQVLSGLGNDRVQAYHLGWAHFGLLLPDAVAVDVSFVVEPLEAAGVGRVAIGVATFPHDDADQLEQLAERRLRGAEHSTN